MKELSDKLLICEKEPMSFADYYNDIASNPNNFSKWFKEIENCGITVPKTLIIQVPENISHAFFMDKPSENRKLISEWIKETVLPAVKDKHIHYNLFIKNGTFSNKFNFATCKTTMNIDKLTSSIIDVNYQAICLGADGFTELVIREFIDYDISKTACIYNGMPLRPEQRVFYDFDKHEVLYSVNYWDYDYCHDEIARNKTDKIVYETVYPEILAEYEKNKSMIEQLVSEKMDNITSLSGIWSIDIMQANNQIYLIDMAIGCQSAYWNPSRL